MDDTRWHLSKQQESDEEWLNGLIESDFGKLQLNSDCSYVVKPIAGAGSEGVAIVKAHEVRNAIQNARSYNNRFRTVNGDLTEAFVDGQHFDLVNDILVEEYHHGPEFTVDGYIRSGNVSFVVQHKETRHVGSFIGDGLIVSPPDFGRDFEAIYNGRHHSVSLPCFCTQMDFERFILRGLKALSIDGWPFHAEVIETKRGLRFVELNPRPGGGLLWHTCGLHLGIDPFAFAVNGLFGEQRSADARRSDSFVTGQFPIYADRTGEFLELKGVDEARSEACVSRIDVVAKRGQVIETVEKENYLAFVAVQGRDHSDVRETWERLKKRLIPVVV